jgi:hypothetical protein
MASLGEEHAEGWERVQYALAWDGTGLVYAGVPGGEIYARDATDGKAVWTSGAAPGAGDIVELLPREDGTLYALGSRGMLLAFDGEGRLAWSQSAYAAGIPWMAQVTKGGDLVLVHGGQVLVFTRDAALTYAQPEPAAPPAGKEAAEKEIVDFLVEFIVEDEIGGTAEYIEQTDQPWVDAPPEANLIAYYPAREGGGDGSMSDLDYDHPIRVWSYAEGTLSEINKDLQGAVDEYRQKYMEDPESNIWAWGSYDFGIVSVGDDLVTAQVYVGASCGPVCGHGFYYYLQRSPSGDWWIYDSRQLWQS